MVRGAVSRTLVIPMYREARRIEATIATLASSALACPEVELIFVDDGSDDGTADVVASALDSFALGARLIKLDSNRGKGAAVRAGVLEANGRSIAFVDADLSAGVMEIERCFHLLEAGGCDVVATTRGAPLSNVVIPQSPFRQLSGKLFNLLLRALGLTRMADTQCGLKAFTRETAIALFEGLMTARFAFDVEVLMQAELHGMVVRELPIEWKHIEESRVRPLKDSSRMISDVVQLRRHFGRHMRTSSRHMSAAKFDVTAKVETHHWWFRAKRELLVQELRRVGAMGSVAVDAGCGTGEVVRCLNQLPFEMVVGADLSLYALELARKEAALPTPLLASEAGVLGMRTGAAECLVTLDVLEHLDDDVAALREFARVVKPGGTIAVAVPAYAWAWSDHDVVLGHRRRYTRRGLLEVAERAGLVVQRCTYYHSWLVPLALAVRRTPLRRLLRGEAEEASYVNPRVNSLLSAVAAVERVACRFFDVPFGLSLMLVTRSQGPQP
ncbi:MAG: glycosyltransferase [Actinomycetota bacterium]|nr:glycosyltransferase [Actinomycetota bacterium]